MCVFFSLNLFIFFLIYKSAIVDLRSLLLILKAAVFICLLFLTLDFYLFFWLRDFSENHSAQLLLTCS